MTQIAVELIAALIGASVVLDTIYRLYIKFTTNRESVLESKQSVKVAQDEVADAKDKNQAKTDQDTFNNSVDKFESDTK